MTKLRPPVTFEHALVRIAGLIDYPAMGRIVGQAERTVRDWSDPDITAQCSIAAAEKLDAAYRSAGGEGAPMYEAYSLMVGTTDPIRFADQFELARRACTLIREGSEAEEALVLASLPSATRRDRTSAMRELEELISVATATVALLRQSEPPP